MATVQPKLIQFNAFPYIAVGTIAIDCSLSESGSQVKIKSSSKQDISISIFIIPSIFKGSCILKLQNYKLGWNEPRKSNQYGCLHLKGTVRPLAKKTPFTFMWHKEKSATLRKHTDWSKEEKITVFTIKFRSMTGGFNNNEQFNVSITEKFTIQSMETKKTFNAA